ncbi:MAG: HEAT repeat domain-containing protein [Chloroflexota bacterium]
MNRRNDVLKSDLIDLGLSLPVEEIAKTTAGRRWIRANATVTTEVADRLLAYEDDFTTQRRDLTLSRVIDRASQDALLARAGVIAGGAGARALWQRLAADRVDIASVAIQVLEARHSEASRATVSLLVLDPLDAHSVGHEGRVAIATAALDAEDDEARSAAAQFLATESAESVATRLVQLVEDPAPAVRASAWQAGLRVKAAESWELIVELLGDEGQDISVRRSALQAAGQHLPTAQVEDILAFFVVHPNADLAMDAATLFHGLHRSPVVAEAAIRSPHEGVRDVANRLMDPYQGSPAAGGSRPGDPTSGDAYARMLRLLESRETEE